jgi:hypothetical protein
MSTLVYESWSGCQAAGNSALADEPASLPVIDALSRLVSELENEPSLVQPDQLRWRFEALDRLDAFVPYVPAEAFSVESGLYRRARAVCARLEAANCELYEGVRSEIRSGSRPDSLLQRVLPSLDMERASGPARGLGYDYVDELISGVFQFEEPDDGHLPRDSEKLFYQPTPARHIFTLMALTALTATDVFVDLGSGLGHVPLLVSICTGARSIGIEVESTYVECARQCAQSLNLKKVTFLREDARTADLSNGTVFYLYTPFMGSILRTVLKRLRREAATRGIRICSYGPCTSVIANEPWLEAATEPDAHRITVFCSRV